MSQAMTEYDRGYNQCMTDNNLREDTNRLGKLTVHHHNQTVYYDGNRIRMTDQEYKLLALLMINPNQTVDRKTIYGVITGLMAGEDTKLIDVIVCKLRNKIGNKKVIETVYRTGYALRDGS